MRLTIWMLVLFSIVACQQEKKSTVEHPMKDSGFYSQLKKNEDMDMPDEEAGLGKIRWDKEEHDFGEILDGDMVSHTFTFTNTGEGPLTLTDTKTRCGCTVPEYSEDPIMPGQQGEMTVLYDSKDQLGEQSKAIVVYCNGTPRKTALVVRATVLAKN